MSLPLWECGLKYNCYLLTHLGTSVTPLVGVWIEIAMLVHTCHNSSSLPLWECGLKCGIISGVNTAIGSLPLWECGLKYIIHSDCMICGIVTPLVGVWIEIHQAGRKNHGLFVTPLVGVWIEISRYIKLSGLSSVTPLAGVWIKI